MSTPFRSAVLSTLTAAVLAVLGGAYAPTQAYAAGLDSAQESSRAAQASERARKRREERAAREQGADGKSGGDGQSGPAYPNATRKPPETKSTGKNNRALSQIQKDLNDGKYQQVIDSAEAVPAGFNAYEKAFVYTWAADAAIKLDREDLATTYFARVVETNGMDNNGHYQAMLNLAILQNNQKKHAEALATIERFLEETKSDDRDHQNMRGQILIEMERPREAAAVYDKLLATFPDDKNIFANTVALHSQLGNNGRVVELLKLARQKNLLTEASEYRNLYWPMIQAGKFAEANELIEEAVTKGIMQRDERLAADYLHMAETAFFDKNDVPTAIEYYKRADQASKKGEAALNLAKVLFNEGRMAEARQAAQRALDKGVSKPEEARRIVNAK